MKQVRNALCMFLLFLAPSLIALSSLPAPIRQQALNDLNQWLAEARDDAITLINQARETASSLKGDTFLKASLKATCHLSAYRKSHGPLPPNTRGVLTSLSKDLRSHFLNRYLLFYDLLLVSPKGEVVFSIRQERDLGINLLHPPWTDTPLGQSLHNRQQPQTVDFQAYPPTGEASAFFVQPVHEDGRFEGWLILQLTINHLNQTLASPRGKGQTGEVLLVNRDRFLLTESRFETQGGILSQQLPHANIEIKFRERAGWREVVDYRGQPVLSAFEVLPIRDLNWLLIAKQDQAEILSRYLLGCPDRDVLLEKVWNLLPPPPSTCPTPTGKASNDRQIELVHMDHWKRTTHPVLLRTPGVSTCTAVVMHLPGRFTCLAHISPMDHLYGQEQYRVLSGMLRKMSDLEMIPREKRKVSFIIVSPKPSVFSALAIHLLDEGYFLSQMRFLASPQARYADVTASHPEGDVDIVWHNAPDGSTTFTVPRRPTLAEQIRPLL